MDPSSYRALRFGRLFAASSNDGVAKYPTRMARGERTIRYTGFAGR